jgi:hypothetical protein
MITSQIFSDRALQAVALTHLRQHDSSNHYKGLLKALLKAALENVSVQARRAAARSVCSGSGQGNCHTIDALSTRVRTATSGCVAAATPRLVMRRRPRTWRRR